MFRPGQKVVCVDGRFPLGIEKFYPQVPKEGNTYTIRNVVPGISFRGEHGEVAAYLVEIAGPLNSHGIERGFNVERFAPLDEIEEHTLAVQENPAGAV